MKTTTLMILVTSIFYLSTDEFTAPGEKNKISLDFENMNKTIATRKEMEIITPNV
jgi:hypothetical protein